MRWTWIVALAVADVAVAGPLEGSLDALTLLFTATVFFALEDFLDDPGIQHGNRLSSYCLGTVALRGKFHCH